jgi:biopolymer transport protein ExbB/TolQ
MNLVETLLGLTLLGTEWVLWLLVFLSILSLAIMVERTVFFIRIKLDFEGFNHDLTQKLVDEDIDGIKDLCEKSPSLESQVILHGITYQNKGARAMEEYMTGFMTSQRQKLDRGLTVLGTLGNNAPFIGLFGTVIGIIQAFHDLAENPAGGPSVVMAGISEALVATAVGLLVAIPAVIAFNTFQRLVKRKLGNAEAMMKLVVAHFSK